MPSVAINAPPGGGAVGRKKPDEKASDGKQINFRAPNDLASELEDVAEALGLDVSNLVRMVLRENLAQYRERADRIRQQKKIGD